MANNSNKINTLNNCLSPEIIEY